MFCIEVIETHMELYYITLGIQHTCTLSHFSCVQRFVTLWTIVRQTPLSMGFSR